MDQDGNNPKPIDPSAVVGNLALAHEMVMNENFKLQDLPENS